MRPLVLLLLFGLNFSPLRSSATHIVGGEIYWDCITSGPDAGKFIFYFKFVRDCNTLVQPIPNQAEVQLIGMPGLEFGNPLHVVSQIDITPQGCGFSCAVNPGAFGREEVIMATDPVQIVGVPPATGIEVVVSACCRTQTDNYIDATPPQIMLFFRARMYSPNGQNLSTCFDSAPRFSEKPDINVCSGGSFRYAQGSNDPDADDVTYELVELQGESGQPVTYVNGFSPAQPLPGPSPVNLDPATGDLSYTAPTSIQGRYVMGLKVTAWRCGQRISETVRELFTQIVACPGNNTAPTISSPVFASPIGASGYDITVQAGDLVNFTLGGNDPDAGDVLTFTAAGSQFGAGFNDATSGCPFPPCATLSTSTLPYSGPSPASTTFNWQTDCTHLNSNGTCTQQSATYQFSFTLGDGFCPARGSTSATVRITVQGPPLVGAPEPHCTNIAANGDVTVTWAPVTDLVPPSFSEYVIFHATNPAGPFVQVGTEPNINNGTFVHSAGMSPQPSNIVPNYYYIRTRSGCDGLILGPPSDTISTIHLEVINAGTTAELSWNPLMDPMPACSGQYQIYREYPAGTWTLIGTTDGLTYSDPITVCSQQINYQIVVPDCLPCTSASNIDGDIFNNPQPPPLQLVDSVSVDPLTGFVQIGWLPSTATNVISYSVAYQNQSGGWNPQGDYSGWNNTMGIDQVNDPSIQSFCYRIYDVTDDCGNVSTDVSPVHCTMLMAAEVDGCTRSTELQWSPYSSWPEGVQYYEIVVSADGGPETVVDTTTAVTYVHDSLTAEATYCYRIRAVRNITDRRVTSSSNTVCVFVLVPKRPEYQHAYLATVPDNSSVDLKWFIDNTSGYVRFDVLRGTSLDDLKKVGQQTFDPALRLYEFTDTKARPATTDYYYRVLGIDECMLPADTMEYHRTILLNAEAKDDRTNVLTWNAYEGFPGNIAAYRIYRSNESPFSYRAIVPPTTFTFVDDVDSILVGEGRFCYYVEALEANATTWGPPDAPETFQEISRSNEACALQLPNVFVPTAFTPGGLNPLFRPVTHFVEADDYLFRVMNRWGMVVYETNTLSDAWDGTCNGNMAPEGVYAYFIHYVNSRGNPFEMTGTFHLIKYD